MGKYQKQLYQQKQHLQRPQELELPNLNNINNEKSKPTSDSLFSDFVPWSFSDIPEDVIDQKNKSNADATLDENKPGESKQSLNYSNSQEIDYDAILDSSPPADVLECLFDDESQNLENAIKDTMNESQSLNNAKKEDTLDEEYGTLEIPEITKTFEVPYDLLNEIPDDLSDFSVTTSQVATQTSSQDTKLRTAAKRKSEQEDVAKEEKAGIKIEGEPKQKIFKREPSPSSTLPTADTKIKPQKQAPLQSRLTGFVNPLVPQLDPSAIVDPGVISNGAQPMAQSSKDLKPATEIFLSAEQRRVIDLVVHQRKSLFFTGAAGTGKSILLRRIIRELKRKCRNGEVAVTASTGLAACNIGGITLHSYCGIGIAVEDADGLLKKIRNNPQALKRWKKTKVIIIDEMSMIDGNLFDKLEYIARKIKRNTLPFGGIQIIVSGDFFQLPPVFKQETDIYGEPLKKTEDLLAFQAKTWNSVIEVTVELKQVFRQKDDHFSRMLSSIREGLVTKEIEDQFRSLSRQLVVPEGITPTEIFPLRHAVDRANRNQMGKLKGEAVRFKSIDTYNTEAAKKKQILKFLMCPEDVSFKVGAQVMLIKNMDETLVNGSLGKVIGFMSESTFQIVAQLPPKDAEKVISGKMSVEEGIDSCLPDSEEEDDSIAEIKSPIWKMENDDPFNIPGNYEELDKMGHSSANWGRKKRLVQMLQEQSQDVGRKWPYVRFMIPDGTTRDVLVQAEKWEIENLEGKLEASRSQVPLILAWALSVHKCQGQTLHWVKVDLRTIFEHGQSYVALSRAVSMDGLQVIGFEKSKVTVHPDVIDFYQNLPSPLDI